MDSIWSLPKISGSSLKGKVFKRRDNDLLIFLYPDPTRGPIETIAVSSTPTLFLSHQTASFSHSDLDLQFQGWILNGLSQSELSYFLCHQASLRDGGVSWGDPIREKLSTFVQWLWREIVASLPQMWTNKCAVWLLLQPPGHHTWEFSSTFPGAHILFAVSLILSQALSLL